MHDVEVIDAQPKGVFNSAAVEQAEAGLSVDPKFATLHNTMGNALVQNGNLTRAAKHYRQAMLLAPELRSARVNLGNVRNSS